MWVSSWLEGLRQLDVKNGRVTVNVDFPRHQNSFSFADWSGDLWVAGADRVDPLSSQVIEHIWTDESRQTHVRADSMRLSKAGGLSGTEILTISGDREGNVWVGTF